MWILEKNTPNRESVVHRAFWKKNVFGLVIRIFNNYSPKWRWLVVDIYRAASRGEWSLFIFSFRENIPVNGIPRKSHHFHKSIFERGLSTNLGALPLKPRNICGGVRGLRPLSSNTIGGGGGWRDVTPAPIPKRGGGWYGYCGFPCSRIPFPLGVLSP